MELFFSKIHQLFRATDAVSEGDNSLMRAVASSVGESEDILSEWIQQIMLEMYSHCNEYCNNFDLEAGEFSTEHGYYAQIQALANTQSLIIKLYELDEFDSSKMTSLPYTEYTPRQGEEAAKASAFILNDGKTHHVLHPHPTADPQSDDEQDDSNSNPPVHEVKIATETEAKQQPSSMEKVKSLFGFGTSTKQGASSSTEPRKLDTVFDNEAVSTAQTVQRSGSSNQNPPPVEKKKKKKKSAPVGSPRMTRARKAKGGTPRSN